MIFLLLILPAFLFMCLIFFLPVLGIDFGDCIINVDRLLNVHLEAILFATMIKGLPPLASE